MRFKEFLVNEDSPLAESSLSRLNSYLQNYDVAFITAYRYNRSRNSNMKANYELRKRLEDLGYRMFKVKGSYDNQETGIPDKEESFAVINANAKPFDDFVTDMTHLGSLYNQESVLIFPKGEQGSFYYDNGIIEPAGTGHFGKDNAYKSLVNGRPFVVESVKYCDRLLKTAGQVNNLKED